MNHLILVEVFYQQILREKDDDHCICVLCGNKCDLSDKRQVSNDEGMACAKSFSCPFFETSAKTGENVQEAFLALVHRCLDPTNSKNSNVDSSEELKTKNKCIIC